MTLWRERIKTSIAKSRDMKGGNYVQLATCDHDGEPRVRTVVFRGFAPNGAMKMITDKRSAKVSESTRCELCWWFPRSSEQYRISGTLHYVGDDETNAERRTQRQEMWGKLSDKAREQFYWEHVPRTPYNQSPEKPPAGGRDSETGEILEPPPPIFLLVLLEPLVCDYLRLEDNFRQIDRLADREWVSERVNP
ncbi:hypothetical protein CTAYLR_005933 [Chrysophaeum taylorii]|uniref:Pyridoxamine 5'-phosphate oxidase Alr4036 family FMN-binding domain-containing protein n=1 Tax=Chrysophaeum taylorii TaxID=2483200 RepID=A0AAD7XK97_9STRA|nr:hypothetical protein CTAYLR_005933 [Chrysophaeum taylorii]